MHSALIQQCIHLHEAIQQCTNVAVPHKTCLRITRLCQSGCIVCTISQSYASKTYLVYGLWAKVPLVTKMPKVWYIDSSTSATTDTLGSNDLRINVGHVWALEHCVVTRILKATDYTFTTPD